MACLFVLAVSEFSAHLVIEVCSVWHRLDVFILVRQIGLFIALSDE